MLLCTIIWERSANSKPVQPSIGDVNDAAQEAGIDLSLLARAIGGFPYEIWSYYETGNSSFVFLDRDGSGNYMQIYSTVDGELSYPDWQNMIQPVQTDMSPTPE